MDNQLQLLLVMVVYLVLLILWGLYQGRKVKTGEDYSIAGRQLPGWAAALSERATGESSWALLGLPGAAYALGVTEVWTAIGCVAGIITAWVFLAWRLRDEAEKYQINTFTDYLAKRHNELGNAIRITGSFIIIFFFFFYVGAQFSGGGKTLHTLFGLNARTGMIITALIIIPYTIYGGFLSVVYTDVVQAIIMIITLIVTPIVGFIYLSNHPDLFAQNIPDALSKAGESYTSFTGSAKGFAAGIIIAGSFSWFFGYLGGMPQLTTRFMAIKDRKQAIRARNIGVAWTIIAYIGALCIGWIGIAIFGPGTLEDREYVMPSVVLKLFPPAIASLMMTGAIAAMISTADSILILSSTEMAENMVRLQQKRKLAMSRLFTALIAIVALLLAYFSYAPPKLTDESYQILRNNKVPEQVIITLQNTHDGFTTREEYNEILKNVLSKEDYTENKEIILKSMKEGGTLIFTMVGYVWAGIGSPFSIIILLTLFWRRFHGRAVVITLISGLLFTIVWISSGMDKEISARIMTFAFSLVVAVVSTFLIKKKQAVI